VSKGYVLVTGGAGYIGSHTCKALALGGYVPVAYDNLSIGNISSVKWGPFIQGDLLDEDKLNQTFKQYDFSGVIHFAAKAYVGESIQNPIKYFEGNVSSTISLLKSMQLVRNSRLVFSSSCATYGEPEVERISEKVLQNPINPYGISKHVCETLIQSVAKTNSLKFGILRYFNAAGADADGEIGELHEPETHLIPLALKAAIADSSFNVFGGDFDTNDGSAVRDYIHVTDLANAHVRAFNRLNEGVDSFTCNLGSGVGYSVLEIMNEIRTLFPKFSYSVVERRPGDPARLVADASLAEKLLGFTPVLSGLDNILNSSLKWELSQHQN
jgi:UDP-arabinose 4-epimerase